MTTGFIYMKMNALLQALILLILVASCAKTPGKTDAKFKLKISSLTDLGSAGAGGAMLWGKSDKGDMFGVNISTGSELSLELANGSWSFWSVAWEGKNTIYNFQGLTRCAKSNSIFNGTDAQININLSNATCADSDFSPAVSLRSGVYEFPTISRFECDKLSNHNGLGCGVGDLSGKTTSRRLLMPAFKKASGGAIEFSGGALVSACHSGGTNEMIDTHLPVGNGVIPAFTVLQSFFSVSSCDETDPKGFAKENFEMGLKATPNPNAMTFINNGTCNGSNFTETSCGLFGGSYSAGVCNGLITYVQTEISENACIAYGGTYTVGPIKKFELITTIPDDVLCSGKRIDPAVKSPHVFAAGVGIPANPFRICKEYQLNSIGAAYTDKSFSLHADLDMNVTSVLGNGPVNSCLGPGANFIPIGGLYDESCNEIPAVHFGTGVFRGNNHTISNIRLHSKLSNIGFIRDGGSVLNLTLNNIEIEGTSNVGAFSGSTSGVLSNLSLKKSKVRGQTAVGGIVGTYTPTVAVLNNLNVKKSFIRIDGTQGFGGGLVGDTKMLDIPLTINKSSFEGVITAAGTQVAAGGLVGAASITPLTINESYSSGAALVHGSSWAGGLVGAAPLGVNINNSYSRMNFGPGTYDIGEGGNIGGLVGKWAIFSNVTNSFYHGSIMHPCFEKSTPCSVGPLSGGAPATVVNSEGTLLYRAWFSGITLGNTQELSTFETTTTKNNFIQSSTPSLFKDTGASFPRLAWESGECALNTNNLSVALQSKTKGSLTNPIVLCNKEQWKEIKNYPTLNYIVADNLGIGEIAAIDIIPSFSGTINGNGNVIGGIYNLATTTTSGIIANNYGKISNTIFAASYLDIISMANPAAGLVGVNQQAGQIFDNQFLSVNIKKSTADMTGAVAGINYGRIYRNKISSVSSITNSGGLLVGSNMSEGVLTGNQVSGTLTLLANTDNIYVGLAAATNSGKISETDISGTIVNSATGNTGSGSGIGAFVGSHFGVAEDILVKPSAKLIIGIAGPTYGQVFGQVLDGAKVKNVLALNETPIPLSATSANVQSFAGFGDSSATYKNSYQLTGNVFRFSSSPVVVNGCNQTGNIFTYDLSAFLVLTSPYLDGLYLPNISGAHVSSRITSTLSNGIGSIVSNLDDGHFVLPCSAGGIAVGTTTFYPIKTEPDFSHAEVHSSSMRNLKSFEYFCPSSLSVSSSSRTYAFCGSGELNMVEDAGAFGFGFQRLLSAHKTWLQTGYPPEDRPVWVMSDEGYPKLFIAH
ncbi:hypothetical protein SHI21_18790 [Bacteriovorax sp. PP10]|uniref:Uncharacterized protein n=1 Tax=Bacteriovorax antarcticus TaxID=3088717 RepID=A0ABU5W3B1_9BACT|nr:hypothetical protein [Bacteriovorax sp. PP10]MEA9358290.1 hypothetical protein [Bacteriovorax sp. PP10]